MNKYDKKSSYSRNQEGSQDLLYFDSIDQYFFVKDRSIFHKAELKEIIWIQSDGNYCTINTTDKKYVIYSSLKRIFLKLPSSQFVRIHHSYLVNSEHIKGLDLLQNLILLDHHELPLGRTYKEKLLKRIYRI